MVKLNNKSKGQLNKLTKKIQKHSSFGKFATDKQTKKDKNNSDRASVLAKLQKLNKGNAFKDMRGKKQIKNLKAHDREKNMASGKKASKYELLSDDDEDMGILNLTHKGKNLENIDDFKEEIDNFSDEDEAINGNDAVDNMNFQGFNDEEIMKLGGVSTKKNKKEVYEEIIKKSKQFKHLKQKQKDDDFEKLKELEDGYDQLVELLPLRQKQARFVEKDKYKAANKDDDYDAMVNEFQFADRAPAAIEKRIAKPESAKQTRSQKEAQAISGILSSDEDEPDLVNDDELEVGKKRKEKRIMKHIRNVEKLNNYMDKIKNVKVERLMQEKEVLEGSDFDGEGEFDEEEFDGEGSDSDQYGLNDIDLDDVENNNRGSGEEDFEDEFEDEDGEEEDNGEEGDDGEQVDKYEDEEEEEEDEEDKE